MEPLSAASAIGSLISVGGKLSIEAYTFIGKVKDAPQRVTAIHSDLKTTVYALGKIEAAIQRPEGQGVFSLQHAREDFESVIQTLMQVFNELSNLMKKYDKVNSSVYQKAKWATVGLDEATELGKVLAVHKANLLLTVQLTQSEALASIGAGVENIEQHVRAMRDGMQRLPQPKTEHHQLEQWLESLTTYAGSVVAEDNASVASMHELEGDPIYELPTQIDAFEESSGQNDPDHRAASRSSRPKSLHQETDSELCSVTDNLEVERFTWTSVPPPLFSCIEYLRSQLEGKSTGTISRLIDDGFTSAPLRTDSFERLQRNKELREAFQTGAAVTTFSSDSTGLCDICRVLLWYFQNRSPLIPEKVQSRIAKLGAYDNSFRSDATVTAILEHEVQDQNMPVADYQTLRYLLQFFNALVNPEQRAIDSTFSRSDAYKLGRVFHQNLGFDYVWRAATFIYSYHDLFEPLIQKPGTEDNLFLFVERPTERNKLEPAEKSICISM